MLHNEIRIDTLSGMIGTPVYMRMIHVPTGETVEGRGVSRFKLRDELYRQLEGKIGVDTRKEGIDVQRN